MYIVYVPIHINTGKMKVTRPPNELFFPLLSRFLKQFLRAGSVERAIGKKKVDHFRSLRRYETSITRTKTKKEKRRENIKIQTKRRAEKHARARLSSPFTLARRKIRLREHA